MFRESEEPYTGAFPSSVSTTINTAANRHYALQQSAGDEVKSKVFATALHGTAVGICTLRALAAIEYDLPSGSKMT